jgi:hypothetical protein
MKMGLAVIVAYLCAAVGALGQGSVVVNLPGEDAKKASLSMTERFLMDKSVLPRVRSKLLADACEESISVAAIVHGSFTRPGAIQKLVFYQFCETGNGLGSAGVAVTENGFVANNFIAPDAGFTISAKTLPDLDRNGIDEVALYWSGGIHQGAGGTGVDIIEFNSRAPRMIGWFQAESFDEDTPAIGYRVTANPGKPPKYFREKYTQNAGGKWRKTGKAAPLRLSPAVISWTKVN